MSAASTANPIPVLGIVLKRPATGYSVEQSNASGLERSSVSAGCSRNLMESLNQRRPSLQRLHTPFRGTNRFARDKCCSSNGSESRVLDDSILNGEFTAMQDRKLWETLLKFIEDISVSIQNEDLDQLQKILHFDQGNLPQSPSRFFRSAVTSHSGMHLGSGFGSDQPLGNHFDDPAGPIRPGGFRDILGEIFHCFETYFPSIRWNFKMQLEEEEAMQQLITLHGAKILAVQKVVQEEQVREVQPAKLNTRQMLQMKIEAERMERAENFKLLQEGKIKGIQQTPLQMRCSKFFQIYSECHEEINSRTGTYRNKNDDHKKTAWQKIQIDWKANSVRITQRICDKVQIHTNNESFMFIFDVCYNLDLISR